LDNLEQAGYFLHLSAQRRPIFVLKVEARIAVGEISLRQSLAVRLEKLRQPRIANAQLIRQFH